jgi:16S rRNA processing protein RimM
MIRMTTARMETGSHKEFVTVARVRKAQGRIGEVAADLYTDFPEKFAERKRLWAWLPDGSRREMSLEDHWLHKGQIVLKFAGVDSISDAEQLLGSELQIEGAQRAELEAGAVYISDLVGCVVTDGGREIGTVAGIDPSSGEAPNLRVMQGAREFLVPFAEAYLRKLDVAGKRIDMQLPEGLLELDAPLSAEEKKQQHRESDR